MASFTDKAPVFNPYTQQQPVEAMVKVGMYKQQQYDQGVQKIQDTYSKVAGLDVLKDVDRSYLKSKLSETSNKLRGFAAGDFSNNQLTNSVTGLVNNIASDENIRNAVYATRKARTEMSKAADADKEGKSSIVNQWALNSELEKWINDGQLGSSFTGKYTNYIDVDSKLREVYDKMQETENHTENPFIRDVNGNTIYFSPDKKEQSTTPKEGWTSQIDHAMLATTFKGKSAKKILDNFHTSLSADDIKQLELNAKYHYRGKDVNFLKQEFTKRINNKKEQYNQTIIDISNELATRKGLTEDQKIKLTASFNNYTDALKNGELDDELQKGLVALEDKQNADHFKYQIYTDNYLTNMAKDLSTQSIIQEYKSSPYWQAAMDLKQLKFKYDEARRDQANSDRMFNFEREKFAWTKIKDIEEKDDNSIKVTDAAIKTDSDKFTPLSLENDIKELDGGIDEKSPAYGTEGALGKLNSQYGALITDPKLTNEQRNAFLNNLSKNFDKDPSTINQYDQKINIREYLEKRRVLEVEIARKKLLFNKAATHDQAKAFDKSIDKNLANLPRIRFREGREIYTAKDMLEFLDAAKSMYNINKAIPSTGPIPMAVGGTNVKSLNTSELKAKYKGTKFEDLSIIYSAYNEGKQLSEQAKKFMGAFLDISNQAKKTAGAIHSDKINWQTEYIRSHSPEAQEQIGVISNTNKKDISNATDLITLKMNQIKQGVGALDNFKEGDATVDGLSKALKNANTSYIIKKQFNGTTKLEVQHDGVIETLPMTQQELKKYFPNAAISNPLNTAKSLIMSSDIHSTNLNGGKGAADGVTAYFTGKDLPQIANKPYAHRVRFDILGDPMNDGGDTDQFNLQLYYCDENGNWFTRQTDAYTSLSGIMNIMNAVEPSDIDAIKNKNLK